MSINSSSSVPLCVDLDGTLVRTDMLVESVLLLVRQQPIMLLYLPFWLLKGKTFFKQAIASNVLLDDTQYPFNNDVVEYIEEEKSHAREIILVTGSHQSIAEHIGQQTQLFDRVQGTDSAVNLTSNQKRQWLESEFGPGGFDYIGDHTDDLNVWPSARRKLLVARNQNIVKKSGISFDKVFQSPRAGVRDFLKLLRVHQWSKNVLILVPFLLDQRFGDWPATISIVLAFLAMSLLASMTYIINDMLDLQADRQNPTKSKRPLPSGKISLITGGKVVLLLFVSVIFLCLFLPASFNIALLAYLVITLCYSLFFKKVAMLDVCLIAALHTLRVVAGTLAIQAVWSFWLLAFSMFIFFSLALAKRVAELFNLQKADKEKTLGRDYRVSDLPVLIATGVSTGYLSVLIVALYINSDKVRIMYSVPEALWLVCPILMFWIGRIWMKTSRGEMHEDPIIFALRDRVSLDIGGLVAVVVIAAKFL